MASAPVMLVHGTAVSVDGVGVLLRGPPGSGKSDLALRLIDAGARLVADDQTELAAVGGVVVATCPPAIAGLLEVRGVGIVKVPALEAVELACLVDLVPAEAIERMPDPVREVVLGVALPRLGLSPFEASAPAKLRFFIRGLPARRSE